MEFEGGEMALPINSTYGGGQGHGHGHMIHHESAPHNHIVPSSAAAAAEAVVVQQQMPISNGPTIIVPPPPPSSSSMEDTVVPYTNNFKMVIVRYRECLKNHAASIGGTATDGCGEFLPCGEDGTLEALTCSACNCHRNFHRKEIQGDYYNYNNYHSAPPHLNRSFGLGNGRKVSLHGGHHHHHHQIESFPSRPPPMMMSYNMASESDEPHHEMVMKKRFRTKFTQQQKEKMLGFAEKVGWKFQKQDESEVQQFCQELGIKRRVLKVWMHNNKHTLAKKINPISTDSQNQINNN